MKSSAHRQKSLFWKPIAPNPLWETASASANRSSTASAVQSAKPMGTEQTVTQPAAKTATAARQTHSLVNPSQNQRLREYEVQTKAAFDQIESTLKALLAEQGRNDFVNWANQQLSTKLGVTLSASVWQKALNQAAPKGFQTLYAQTLFAQFMNLSQNFFQKDPLAGQQKQEAQRKFKEAGFHAVGVAPCADGRLAHMISYVLRLPYSMARRKAHAGALFDISESVRNWVFIEHTRFREGQPNPANEPTRYLKIAVYHFSKADPSHQGCAAHGSDDHKAAQAALQKLQDFKQAIENRFGCGSTVQILLIGLNTDDDSMKVHIPDGQGELNLDRYVETDKLYQATLGMSAQQAEQALQQAVIECNAAQRASAPQNNLLNLIAWLIGNNFSQIEYVNLYESGCYSDIGHAERFISVGNGFEEVQLRNLSYYSFLDTVEEGVNDVDVGIKIFKGLNVKKGLPIPIIIRCDYDGRVPGSKERAQAKALRIEKALQQRYQELAASGLLHTLPTLRDFNDYQPAERVAGLMDNNQ